MRLLAVGLVSAGVLAYEVLLARLFSIIQWYHFAYMVISIALLGYGASGTFLALARERLEARASAAFAVFAALFGDHRGRVLRDRRAAAVQRARADLGPPPAALSGRPVRDPVRAVLLRRRVRGHRARVLRRAGRTCLSGRSARRRQRRARHPRAPVPGDAEPGARADRSARPARRGAGQRRRGKPARAAAGARPTPPAPWPWRSPCRPPGPPCSCRPTRV